MFVLGKTHIMQASKNILNTILAILAVFYSSVSHAANNLPGNNGVRFIENKGQIADMNGNTRPDILGVATDAGTQLFLRRDGISYVIYQSSEQLAEKEGVEEETDQTLFGNRVDANFVGANINPSVSFNNPTTEYYNYYLQHCQDGITFVKAYNNVYVKNIYNNIDVSYYGEHKGKIKYDFIVNPGGDVNNIKINYSGAQAVLLENDRLTIQTSTGNIGEWMPTVYQEINGEIKKIDAHYTLENTVVGIEVGAYDKNFALVIDPWVTYLGGVAEDRGYGITVTSAGISTITGIASSVNFPVSVGALQVAFSAIRDAFISSFDANGNMVFSTVYGGIGIDEGDDVVVDNNTGNIYFAGSFASAGMSTPGSLPKQVGLGGGADMLVAKFTAAGVRQWATYYGGVGTERAVSIALYSGGDLAIAGMSTGSFPTANAFQNIYGGGNTDVVFFRITPDGRTVPWSSYYGGSGINGDFVGDIDIDNSDNLVINGSTVSTNNIGTLGAEQPNYSGGFSNDAFVAKFNSVGSRIWGTYLGGSVIGLGGGAPDVGTGVAFNNVGDITATGTTASLSFPTSAGAFQGAFISSGTATAAWYNAFLTKLDGRNGRIIWSTYLPFTEGYSVAIDKINELVYLQGGTYAANCPINWGCAFQPNHMGSEDFYISKLDNRNGYPICNTYIGGSDHEDNPPMSTLRGGALALNGYTIYGAGSTRGTNFPVTSGAYQTNWASSGSVYDACVYSFCGFSCGNNTLAPSLSASKTNLCKGDAINFSDLSVLCDTDSAKFLWSFSGAVPSTSTDQNPTNIRYNNFGSFNVKLLITTPCGTDSTTFSNYISVANPTAMITSVNNVSCFGINNGGSTVGAFGGTAPYNYSWNTGGAASSVTNLVAGTYSVTITDFYGCTSSTVVNITQPAVLTATAVVTKSVSCFGGNDGALSVNVNGGTQAYSYSWTTSATNASISTLVIGNYFVTVTDNYGCTAVSQAVNVSQPAILTVNPVGASALCNGQSSGSATATGNGGVGGYIYTWSTGSATNTAGNLAAGIYTVSVTDGNNCVSSNTVLIAEPSILSLTVTPADAHCNQSDGSATVNASGATAPYSYLWNTGITTPTLSSIAAGTYSITVTDDNGCTSASSVQVNNLNGVTANIQASSPASCNGACDGWATAVGISGNAPYNYLWSNANASNNANNLCAGTFSVTITDDDGCTATTTVVISQPAAITSTLTTTAVNCFGGNDGNISVANISGGTAPFNYLWTNGSAGNSISNTSAGTYSVTITDDNGCSGVFSGTITSPTQLTVNASPATAVCSGTAVNITAAANGGTPAYNYSWSNGLNGASASFTPGVSGNFSVTVTDAKNCTAIGNVSVTVWDLPVVTFNSDNVSGCGPLCINFENTTPNSLTSAWSFGDGTTGYGITADNCYSLPGSYNVSLTVTDINGCSNSLIKPSYITVHPDPVAAFVMNPQPTTILNTTIFFTDKSVGATAWNWSFGDLINSSSSIQHPSFTYPSNDTGTYAVMLTVINEFGCVSTKQDIVIIKGDYALYVPNTFTPNGDGKNEIFIPIGVGVQNDTYEMFIFDRWGNLIFKSTNPSIGWDGKITSNETAQQDVYVWKVNTRDIDNKLHRYTGHVSIVR